MDRQMKVTVFEKLKKYESYLITAHEANFIRSLTNTQMEELIGIGAELGIIYVNNHCPKCALDFVKKLSILYYEYKEKQRSESKPKKEKKERKENKNEGKE